MTKRHILLSFFGLALSVSLQSCINNDDDSLELQTPTALVTVIPNADGSFVMQLDDNTQLIPSNMKVSPFEKKEVRALVNYSESEVSAQGYAFKNVNINWLDSIRTKLPVKDLGEMNDEKYGNDPVDIVPDWVTVAEDGYLTLRIRALWGSPYTSHNLNLITGTNPEDPYELELRHDANGDNGGNWGDALIAFNLNNLPKTNSDVEKIKLKWKSFSGEKTTRFDIKMRPEVQ